MVRILLGFFLILSLSTACRRPCADTDSCLEITVNLPATGSASEIKEYVLYALNDRCEVVAKYTQKMKSFSQTPTIIEVPAQFPETSHLRLVPRSTDSATTRLLPHTWKIGPGADIDRLSGTHKVFANLYPFKYSTTDSNSPWSEVLKEFRFLPRLEPSRKEAILLAVTPKTVVPMWMKNSEITSPAKCEFDKDIRQVSPSPSQRAWSVLAGNMPASMATCKFVDGTEELDQVKPSAPNPDPDWIIHSDVVETVDGRHRDCVLKYSKTDKTIDMYPCEAGIIARDMNNSITNSYVDKNGMINHFSYSSADGKLLARRIILSSGSMPQILDPNIVSSMKSTDRLFMADIDGDNFLDAIMANTGSDEVSWALSSSMNNKGDSVNNLSWPDSGQLRLSAEQIRLDKPLTAESIINIADVDGDLLPDLLVSFVASEPVVVYWGNEAGFSVPPWTIPGNGMKATAVAVGDLDGDCMPEIALGSTDTLRFVRVGSQAP